MESLDITVDVLFEVCFMVNGRCFLSNSRFGKVGWICILCCWFMYVVLFLLLRVEFLGAGLVLVGRKEPAGFVIMN